MSVIYLALACSYLPALCIFCFLSWSNSQLITSHALLLCITKRRYEYRKYHNKGLGPSRLGRDRIDKLNEIGFQWRLRPERVPWDQRFRDLVAFKEENGHCRVPLTVPDLGKWAKYTRDQYVLFMRGQYKKAKITKEKVDRLTAIGFEDSLEERVALGLAEHDHQQQQQHDDGGEQQQAAVAAQQDQAVPYPEVVHQHHGQQQQQGYAEHYHHGDPNQVYPAAGGHHVQPGPGAYHYY